jgi:hypothetical protein
MQASRVSHASDTARPNFPAQAAMAFLWNLSFSLAV